LTLFEALVILFGLMAILAVHVAVKQSGISSYDRHYRGRQRVTVRGDAGWLRAFSRGGVASAPSASWPIEALAATVLHAGSRFIQEPAERSIMPCTSCRRD
jgi:hypothetical protein